ncbi:hypothetical protein [Facklamia sp. P13055]|uniref:hypothetical protein n=1 Tax=Facklamia sp. P13055 TaxID=3421952 RepID=UPI003D166589
MKEGYYKKITNILLVFLLSLGLSSYNSFIAFASDTENSSAETAERELNGDKADFNRFNGVYIVDVNYLASRFGNSDTIIIDTRGQKEAKKGHVSGAIAKSDIQLVKDQITLDPVEATVKDIDRTAVIDTHKLTETIADYKILDSLKKRWSFAWRN